MVSRGESTVKVVVERAEVPCMEELVQGSAS